ncbi:MAG: (d)CMP kinase [Candidatus Omnitrophica bacterium]|nr:(d)CMP kinase [Candidatus Omnitrophota bacterium]MBU1870032.1 (d)CMP kinase [Candidatus Omnitrophota bacterium]
MIIAIDGPAGAGKSTIAKLIAQKLGFLYIDTGAMYRALTLKVLDDKIDINRPEQIIALAKKSDIDLLNNPDGSIKVLLDDVDVSLPIRDPRITKYVSDVAKIKEVREIMVNLQRKFGQRGDCVLDGRDIGTVVFPNADKKFYLDAHFEERVNRRHKELNGMGKGIAFGDVKADLANRDNIDSTREVAPLKRADDAIYVDTTKMSIDEVVQVLLKHLNL